MDILIILAVLFGVVALGWLLIKLIFAYTIACLIYLGFCSIKDNLDG